MIAGLADVVRGHGLERLHHVGVEIPGAGDEVFLVGVLPCQRVRDEVAAVVQIAALDKVVLVGLPAGRMDVGDILPLARRHEFLSKACLRSPAASQIIKVAVRLVGFGGHFFIREHRLAAVDLDIAFAAVGRDVVRRQVPLVHGFRAEPAAGPKQFAARADRHDQRQDDQHNAGNAQRQCAFSG